jgi:hypothetical protein
MYAVSDYRLPGLEVSKGYATMQKLLKLGWQLVATAQVEKEIRESLTSSEDQRLAS